MHDLTRRLRAGSSSARPARLRRLLALVGRRLGGRPPALAPSAAADETVSFPSGQAEAGPAAADDGGGAIRRGDRIGRYVVLRAVGSGGSANVYAAYDPRLDRTVALKVVRGVAGRSRLLREAQAAARLVHPNVVTVHDVGQVGERPFVAMELVDGVTLDAWLRAAARPWRRVVEVLRAAGEGLAAAHAAGLVHGDFKPGNVMLARDGRVLVLDFGLAWKADEAGEPATGASGGWGTPGYVAPEKLRGGPADARADQYSFCVALHRALFDRPAAAVGRREVLRRRVPSEVRRVVERGLAADPDHRHAGMVELLGALGRAADARRRRATWAAGTAAAALLAVVVGPGLAPRDDVCGGVGERLAGVWDDDVRRAVESGFAASGHRAAGDAWRRTRQLLDRYARRWTALSVHACEATRVRGEQSERLLDLQTACLDNRREELATVARVLSQADRDLVDRAVAVAEGLTSLEPCANRALVQAEPAPPADPAAVAAVAAVRGRLAEAKVMEAAGRYGDSLAIAGAALAEARALGHPPVEAEALLRVAMAEGRTGRLSEMRRDLVAAAAVADAAGHDRAVGMAYTFLIIAAVARGDTPDARLWGELSGAALARVPDRDGVAAHRELFLGELAHLEGRYEDAIEHHESYLRMGTHLGVTGRAYAHLYLARQHAALGSLAAAERELRRAHRLFVKVLGGGHRAVAQTLTELGRVRAAAGDPRRALAHYREALAVLDRSGEADDLDTAAALEGRGRALLALGETAAAIAPLERARAVRLARPADPADLAAVHFLLARALWETGEPAGAREEARSARHLLAGLGSVPAGELRELDAWLAARGWSG